jgi:hypothetical protein
MAWAADGVDKQKTRRISGENSGAARSRVSVFASVVGVRSQLHRMRNADDQIYLSQDALPDKSISAAAALHLSQVKSGFC